MEGKGVIVLIAVFYNYLEYDPLDVGAWDLGLYTVGFFFQPGCFWLIIGLRYQG